MKLKNSVFGAFLVLSFFSLVANTAEAGNHFSFNIYVDSGSGSRAGFSVTEQGHPRYYAYTHGRELNSLANRVGAGWVNDYVGVRYARIQGNEHMSTWRASMRYSTGTSRFAHTGNRFIDNTLYQTDVNMRRDYSGINVHTRQRTSFSEYPSWVGRTNQRTMPGANIRSNPVPQQTRNNHEYPEWAR